MLATRRHTKNHYRISLTQRISLDSWSSPLPFFCCNLQPRKPQTVQCSVDQGTSDCSSRCHATLCLAARCHMVPPQPCCPIHCRPAPPAAGQLLGRPAAACFRCGECAQGCQHRLCFTAAGSIGAAVVQAVQVPEAHTPQAQLRCQAALGCQAVWRVKPDLQDMMFGGMKQRAASGCAREVLGGRSLQAPHAC